MEAFKVRTLHDNTTKLYVIIVHKIITYMHKCVESFKV